MLALSEDNQSDVIEVSILLLGIWVLLFSPGSLTT